MYYFVLQELVAFRNFQLNILLYILFAFELLTRSNFPYKRVLRVTREPRTPSRPRDPSLELNKSWLPINHRRLPLTTSREEAGAFIKLVPDTHSRFQLELFCFRYDPLRPPRTRAVTGDPRSENGRGAVRCGEKGFFGGGAALRDM